MKKKILILYTSSGYGHKKIGENIGAVLKTEHDVDLVDLFEVAGGKTASRGTALYLAILKYLPGLWEFFYTNSVFLKLTLPLRTKAARFKAGKVAALLKENNYDIVICTQVTASSIVSYLKGCGLFHGKLVITFSDFHLHPYWLFNNTDLYLANIDEQKEEMIARGIPEEKIAVCGITIPEPQSFDLKDLRARYGLAENDKVLLVLGGGRGLGIDDETVSGLVKLPAKVFIVCGLNEELRNKFEKFYGDNPTVKVLGFVRNLPELYSLANVAVTKPGGLTIAECLSYYLPMVIPTYIPGQERLNYEYLAQNNLIVPELASSLGAIEDELRSGAFAQELKNNPKLRIIVQHGEKVLEAVRGL